MQSIGGGLLINSSRISEASSKYRISADGVYHEQRKQSAGNVAALVEAKMILKNAAAADDSEPQVIKKVNSSHTKSINIPH